MDEHLRQKCAGSVPRDLHTDADQQKCRELHNHGHPRSAQDPCQAIGESVAEKYADREQDAPKSGRQDA